MEINVSLIRKVLLAFIILGTYIVITFINIDWGMPDRRSSAIDNLILDGYWAHSGRDLSHENIDLYPPICYMQMELIFRFLRPFLLPREANLGRSKLASYYIIAGRSISAIATLATAWLVFIICRQLFCTRSATWASTLYLLNPVTNYYGITTNAEAEYIFYFTLTWYFFWQFLQYSKQIIYIYIFFACSAVAVATKDQAAFLLVGPIIWVIIRQPKHAILGSLVGLALFVLIYISWGGIYHLPNHIASMRENSKLFVVYSNHPLDLLKLTADFMWDLVRTLGLAFLVFPASFLLADKKRGSIILLNNAILAVLVPYFLAILFLAHRSNPRYVLPFLPLAAIVGGFVIRHLEDKPWGRCFRWLIIAILLGWTIGFVFYLKQNPRDVSKRLIRAATSAHVLPKNSILCLFTKRMGTKYVQGPQHKWIPVEHERDWIWERYGWVSSDIRLITLLPEQHKEVQRIRPDLLIIFDSDQIKLPIRNYRKLFRFTNKFAQIYGYICKPEEFELYAADHIKMKIFKDGSFY